MDKPANTVVLRDWPGLVTHADRQDVNPGAGTEQTNCQSDRMGELTVRDGLVLVEFDSE